MKKVFFMLLFIGVFGWLFAASASWNYDTQTGNIGTTYSWIDASGGTELTLGDDASDTVTWPFDFSIYDDNYTSGTDEISVCSNGFMRFDGAAATSWSTASGYDLTSDATSLGQIIGVGIQDDNVGDSNSHVYWNVTGSSPNRIFTIEYQDLEISYSANHYADIEVQFYEADKKIVMLFGDDDVTTTSADQGIHSGVANYFYKWGDVDTNTNQTWLELTVPSNPGPGSPSNPNPSDGAVNVAIDNNPDISWDNPTGASYNYVYFGTDQTLVDNMDSSVEVLGDGSTLYTSYDETSDLANNTTYYWKVVEYDSGGASTEGPVWSFTTAMAPQSVPYSTDFSSTDGWTQQSDGCTSRWGVSSSNQAGGTSPEMAAVYENADPAISRLISPPINTTGYSSLQLVFKHFYDAYGSGITIKIQTSTDLSTWTDESWVYVDPTSNIGPETVTTTISNNLGGTTYVAWVLDGNLYQFDYWYVDDVTIQEPPSCPAPTDQAESNITVSSADLDWTENGTATQWEIEYGPTGFAQGSGTTVTATSHPYTLSGLSANTTYDWYVRAVCQEALPGQPGEYSDWTGPSTFNTLCNAQSTFPYTYGFEDQTTGDNGSCPASDGSVDLVSCWYNVSGEGSDWKPNSGGTASSDTGPSSAQEGSIYMYCETSNSCGPEFDLYAPTFDFTSLTTPYIEFYYHMYGASVGKLSLLGSTDGGTTWDTLWTKSGDQGDAWDKATVTTSYGGQSNVLLKWNYANPTSYTGDVAIDNVTVEEAPSCPDPADQTVSDILNTSAVLDWTENGSPAGFQIEYGPTGFTQGTGTTVSTSSHPYTLTGLTASTTYDWYVRETCGLNGNSNWIGPNTFTTLADYEVDATCSNPSKAGWVGSNIEYTINIANLGGNDDTYNLGILENSYTAEWTDNTGTTVTTTSTIPATTDEYYFVDVSIPADATEIDTFKVTVTSVGDNTVSDTLTLIVTPLLPYGGPDTAGYTWKNNYATGGPTYSWIDLNSKTEITGLDDDSYAGPFDIGFVFPFYGHTYTQFFVGSNGLITFGSGSSTFSNSSIPNTSAPDTLIAWFWDDLDPGDNPDGDTHVYYDKTLVGSDSCMVISFLNYHEYPGQNAGKLTAQVILYPNGDIKLQYKSFEGGIDMNSATVGIENEGGTDGLQYEYNENKLDDEMAVMFYAPATAPAIPTNLTITINGNDVDLAWDAVSGANSYIIYRATDPYATFTNIGTSSTNSYTDTGAAASGTKYFYYVKSSDATAVLTIPGKPKVVIEHYRK